jgi:hypothetical protein
LICVDSLRLVLQGEEIPEWATWRFQSGNQKSILEYALPALTRKEKKSFHRYMSLYFYETGSSFSKIENERLLQALRVLRPDVTLPSRKKLGNENLEEVYVDLTSKLNEKLTSNYEGVLVTDGWTNVNSDSIVNYIVASPQGTFFLESFKTEESHTGQWLSDDISRVIESYPYNLTPAPIKRL